MPLAVLLSVHSGVGGCGCPSSVSVTLSGSASFAFMNNAAISASAADAMTCLITFARIVIGPLWICLLLLRLPRKVYPPALDRAFDATRYAASEWLCSVMSLARNRTVASGLVAQQSRNCFIAFAVASVPSLTLVARSFSACIIVQSTALAQHRNVPQTCCNDRWSSADIFGDLSVVAICRFVP